MPGKVLPDSLIDQLVRAGKSDADIRRYLQEHENITVTRQAISVWRKRRGDESRRPAMVKAIPWRLRPEHMMSEPARAIRWQARLDAGLPISEAEERRLAKVKAELDAVGGVLVYDADHPAGWGVVPRREGVDLGLIREPDRD